MTAIKGAWTLQSTNDALSGRLHDGALLLAASTSANSVWRSGVLPSTYLGGLFQDLAVVQQGSPNMSVIVGPGSAVITRAGQGPYIAYSNANATVTIATSNPTNPRIDLIYCQVLDNALGDGSTGAKVDVVAGTPAGSPTVPALPANAIPLAQVAVAANATSIVTANITLIRKSAGLRGAPRPLLEGDLLADVGFMPGEQRCRLHATYGILVDTWGFDAKWHGTQALTVNGVYGSIVTGSLLWGSGVLEALTTVTVPDPGWPYTVSLSSKYGASGIPASNYITGHIGMDNAAPTVSGGGTTLTPAAVASALLWNRFTGANTGDLDIPSVNTGVLTGAHVFYQFGYSPAGGVTVGPSPETYLSARITPA